LELAKAGVRARLGELGHLAGLFRSFRSEVQRAAVEREDDRAPSLRFGATKTADGEYFMRMLCHSAAEQSLAAIDAVGAFSTAFEPRPLARLAVERARARLLNGLSMLAWGREEMLDCDVAVEPPAWLIGERILTAGEQVEIPAIPEIARLDATRHPYDRRFVGETEAALDALLDCVGSGSEVEDDAEGEEEEVEESECEAARPGHCRQLEAAADRLREEVWSPFLDLAEAGWARGYRFGPAELALLELRGLLARADTALEERCERDRNAERGRREYLDGTVSLVRDLDPGLGATLDQLLRNSAPPR
jgi:hypothetical protein